MSQSWKYQPEHSVQFPAKEKIHGRAKITIVSNQNYFVHVQHLTSSLGFMLYIGSAQNLLRGGKKRSEFTERW